MYTWLEKNVFYVQDVHSRTKTFVNRNSYNILLSYLNDNNYLRIVIQ